jgi:hypothetical protein
MMPSMVLEEPAESCWPPRYVEYLNACTLLADDDEPAASVSADTGSMPLSRRKLYTS